MNLFKTIVNQTFFPQKKSYTYFSFSQKTKETDLQKKSTKSFVCQNSSFLHTNNFTQNNFVPKNQTQIVKR